MSERQQTQTRPKPSCWVLRDRLGSVPRKPLETSKQNAKVRRTIRKALSDGPRTIPQLSQTTGIPSREVFWHLASLRKYGEIIEGEERDSYVEYALKPKEGEVS